jgi:hypothetical protein
VKTIAAVADDLLGGPTGTVPVEAFDPVSGRGRRVHRMQDLSVIVAVVATEAAWVIFLGYELWFRLL